LVETGSESVLDMYILQTLTAIREQTERCLKDYNRERTYERILGKATP
jgi:hypothetical protein